ncbi:hypothetical protein MTR67_037211 [Solanum verrucosum]|uniref:Uncharacterized protein n=1 Tax=Solanum verrucosum TaxID=315347 RepID=A0AAF0UE38_SOLVR|nr:hypothetical protein MTR67_037211 [Solanum verrucosum]
MSARMRVCLGTINGS